MSKKSTTLCGSVKTVVEYLEYAIHSLLYQRGLYPADDFKIIKKYNLSLLISNDDKVNEYIKNILSQLETWLESKVISKSVMVINSKETGKILERWTFDIHILQDTQEASPVEKSDKEIQSEIAAVLRQITASVSFLPVLDESCSFNILAYTDKDIQVPSTWIDSDPKLIQSNAEQVKLKSFSTQIHKIDSLVTYALNE